MPPRSIDIENHQELLSYLREKRRIDARENPLVETLTGGVSNRVVRLRRESGETWVLKQALPKLRVPTEWFSDPRRIQREALGIFWLSKLAPPGAITPLVFADDQHDLLAMEAVPDPHENWKAVLLSGRSEDEHVRQFAHLLAQIHRRSAGNSHLAGVFDDRSFFESLRIEPYYAYTAEQVPAAADFLHALIADCRTRRICLVHGDYSPKNILVHAGKLVLLDHEVIHYGDPAFDIGFAMAHLLSKAHHLAALRTRFAEAAKLFWREYLSASGMKQRDPDIEPTAVRHTLGCLLARVAGRSQLEYLTPDEKQTQQSAVIRLLPTPSLGLAALVDEFIAGCA